MLARLFWGNLVSSKLSRRVVSCIVSGPVISEMCDASVAGTQMVVFEVGDHPEAEVERHGTFQLPYTGVTKAYSKDELASLKKTVEPFL